MHYHLTQKPSRGFTIVELLIVVVVIAILAAITIVAYNGIRDRAQAAALQADLSGAAKKIALDQVNNSAYPESLADTDNGKGVQSSNGTTYQYSVNNTTNPPTYCVTATNKTKTYKVDQSGKISEGACPGHGVGGVAPITNIVQMPRGTAAASGSGIAGWKTDRWFGGTGANGTYTFVTNANDGPIGIDSYARKQWTSVNGSPNGDIGFSNAPGSSSSTFSGGLSIKAGTTYTFSSYVRSNINYNGAGIHVFWHDGAGAYLSAQASTPIALTAGQWTRLTLTATSPANATTVGVVSDLDGSAATVGMTLDGTGLMINEGPLYSYADGTSPNWVWNGTAHNATSTGPPF
jgi:prepilin-type N-terminal cleavage/methylation domain-containing protein